MQSPCRRPCHYHSNWQLWRDLRGWLTTHLPSTGSPWQDWPLSHVIIWSVQWRPRTMWISWWPVYYKTPRTCSAQLPQNPLRVGELCSQETNLFLDIKIFLLTLSKYVSSNFHILNLMLSDITKVNLTIIYSLGSQRVPDNYHTKVINKKVISVWYK